MAQRPAIMSVHFVDSYGIPGQSSYNIEVDDTKTLAQLEIDLSLMLSDITPLSQAVATEMVYTQRFPTTLDPATAAGDIEKGALFNFNNGSDAYATGLLVPDVNPTILTSQGLIDLTNSAVTAFITFMTTSHTVITVVTKGVRALTSLRDALITFRKHRKPLSRKTKEL